MNRFLGAVMAALVVVLLAVPARADNCRRVVVQQQYVAATNYAANYQFATVQPYAVQYVTPLASYTSIGDEYRQAYFAREVAKELHSILQAERAALVAPVPSTQPSQAPPTRAKIAAILAERCAGCHSGKQAPDLSADPASIPEIVRLRALRDVVTGTMPKGKPPLLQDELNEFATWATSSTPAAVLPPGAAATIPPAKK